MSAAWSVVCVRSNIQAAGTQGDSARGVSSLRGYPRIVSYRCLRYMFGDGPTCKVESGGCQTPQPDAIGEGE